MRVQMLNELSTDDFTHSIFDEDTVNQHLNHLKKQNNLFKDQKETFGIWKQVETKREGKLAISIQYDIEDLGKMMPNFVDQLSVPLIAISDS